MKIELDQLIYSAKKVLPRLGTLTLFAVSNLIPADAKAQDCPVPPAPQNLTVDINPGSKSSLSDYSFQLATFRWNTIPNAVYDLRVAIIDGSENPKAPHFVIDGIPESYREQPFPDHIGNLPAYNVSAWLHARTCKSSLPTPISFKVFRDDNTQNSTKPSPVNS
ncbi:MAG: hypothetical protein Q8P92_01560 [Candidatus Daviesbacteria bacterium]|nr:hypothetical protein [Candidatus Daviesbacteria bacterium]